MYQYIILLQDRSTKYFSSHRSNDDVQTTIYFLMILPREGLACNQTTNSYYNLLNNQIISFLGIISSLVKLTRIEENATLGKKHLAQQ